MRRFRERTQGVDVGDRPGKPESEDVPERRLADVPIRDQAEAVLRLPAARRLELLLHAPKPMRLVRSLPDADLYLTVREIGPTDAMPLLALASPEQVQHLIDLESWRGDRFDANRCGAWIALLLESGEPAWKRFLRRMDDELLALLFRNWIRVEQIEYEDRAEVHGHGEGEAGTEKGFLTPDGYHRFSPAISEHAAAIRRLLQIFYESQGDRYQRILWLALWELPSELEEQALHWRQSRLEEHGFPTWEEALSVYAPPEGARTIPDPPTPADPDGLASSRSLLPALAGHGPLSGALETLSGERRERALHGLVSLANRILVADAGDTGDPRAHRASLQKAAGFLRIALDRRGAVDADRAAELLAEIPVVELFREGYKEAAELRRRAVRLTSEGWASSHPDALQLIDPPLRDRVEGLLQPRPCYVELSDAESAGLLRDFRSPEEIGETRAAFELTEIVGDFLVRRLGLDTGRLLRQPCPASGEPYRFSAIWLTLLAWHSTRGEVRGEPLEATQTAEFLRNVASKRTADPEAAARAAEALIQTLTREYELEPRERSLLSAWSRFCQERLAEECGSLDPGVPVDPRYVSCLVLSAER